MKFIEELQLVCWYPSGELTREKILDYYQGIRDCPFGASANRFCDFSRITSFQLDHDLLRTLVEYRKIYLSDHTRIMLVMNSTTSVGYGMARMYQTLMEDWDMEIHVTGTIEDAARLLDVDPTVLQFPDEPQ